MSRAHHALCLLVELVEHANRQPAYVKAAIKLRPENAYLERARALVLEATRPMTQAAFGRDYCALCDAIHPPLGPMPEPEPHGARRGP